MSAITQSVAASPPQGEHLSPTHYYDHEVSLQEKAYSNEFQPYYQPDESGGEGTLVHLEGILEPHTVWYSEKERGRFHIHESQEDATGASTSHDHQSTQDGSDDELLERIKSMSPRSRRAFRKEMKDGARIMKGFLTQRSEKLHQIESVNLQRLLSLFRSYAYGSSRHCTPRVVKNAKSSINLRLHDWNGSSGWITESPSSIAKSIKDIVDTHRTEIREVLGDSDPRKAEFSEKKVIKKAIDGLSSYELVSLDDHIRREVQLEAEQRHAEYLAREVNRANDPNLYNYDRVLPRMENAAFWPSPPRSSEDEAKKEARIVMKKARQKEINKLLWHKSKNIETMDFGEPELDWQKSENYDDDDQADIYRNCLAQTKNAGEWPEFLLKKYGNHKVGMAFLSDNPEHHYFATNHLWRQHQISEKERLKADSNTQV